MIDLKNTHHHVEFINLPELRPLEIYGLFRLTKFLEPYTNRLVAMCDVQTISGDKIIKREIKSVGIRSGDIPELIGCSSMTANKLMRAYREKNIVKKDKDFFVNPTFVRVRNCLNAANTVSLFEQQDADESADGDI